MSQDPISDIKALIPCLSLEPGEKPVQTARYILDTAIMSGYRGMKAYSLRELSNDQACDYEGYLLGSTTICFAVYEYLCWMLGVDDSFPSFIHPYMDGTRIFIGNGVSTDERNYLALTSSNPSRELDLEALMSLVDGLYRCEASGNESHNFIWLVEGDKIYYAGGYGGVCGPISVEQDKREYFEYYILAMIDGDSQAYAQVYGIDQSELGATGGFSHLVLVKDKTYV